MATIMSFEIPEATAAKLNRLSEKLHRAPAEVASAAVEEYMERMEWQIAEIEAGLLEADRGDFADEAAISAVLGKYGISPAK